jgi:hypothetical protein
MSDVKGLADSFGRAVEAGISEGEKRFANYVRGLIEGEDRDSETVLDSVLSACHETDQPGEESSRG